MNYGRRGLHLTFGWLVADSAISKSRPSPFTSREFAVTLTAAYSIEHNDNVRASDSEQLICLFSPHDNIA